jgi:hypothetical protein
MPSHRHRCVRPAHDCSDHLGNRFSHHNRHHLSSHRLDSASNDRTNHLPNRLYDHHHDHYAFDSAVNFGHDRAHDPRFGQSDHTRYKPGHNLLGHCGDCNLDRPRDGSPDDGLDAHLRAILLACHGIYLIICRLDKSASMLHLVCLSYLERTDEAHAGFSLPAPSGDCSRTGTEPTSA